MGSEPDRYEFWRYGDLVARRIITDRNDLHRKQTLQNFAKPIRLAKGERASALFRVSEVMAWVDANTAHNTAPRLIGPGRGHKKIQPSEAAR